MNVVREINKINERELDLGTTGSWHDDYKDSAYIFIGGLNTELTEGDVIAIFSQYGEVMDVNMPRDKTTGKPRGFAFLMYEDQRSTILAVDNLNGAKVLERTLRVDHVKNYKQPKVKGEDGEFVEMEEQSLNAKPDMIVDNVGSESSEDSGPEIDPEDPMRDYLLAQRKEQKALKKSKKSKDKHKNETPEERRARKQRKKEKKEKKSRKSEGMKAVEELLKELGGRDRGESDRRHHSSSPQRERSRNRELRRREDRMDVDDIPPRRQSRSHSPAFTRRRSPSPHRSRSRRPRSPSPASRNRRARRPEDDNSRGRRFGQPSPPRRRVDYD